MQGLPSLSLTDVYECTTSEALLRLRNNPAAHWSSGWAQHPVAGSAWSRITGSSHFTPFLPTPNFQIDRGERLFTIGSCFAREIEEVMLELDFEVASQSDRFDACPVQAVGQPRHYVNRYNPWSIANELRWALDPEAQYPANALQELPDGRWLDPHSGPILDYTTREETLARRETLREIFAKVATCRLVVITLGLIETFYDTGTGLYTNHTPWLTAEPGRFHFHVLTFAETMAALSDIHSLLRRFGHPEAQIVVTTSPVPLDATFTGQDVVIANGHSKAVLRAAAGEWSTLHDNVHYFPSCFEIVMNSARDAAWQVDGRHVRRELVDHIMECFTGYSLRTELDVDRRVIAVRRCEPCPEQLLGRNIDEPPQRQVTSEVILNVVGWTLGRDAPVVEVRVSQGSTVLARTDVNVVRPDLAAAFQGQEAAYTAGFQFRVDLTEVPIPAELLISAELKDGETIVWGVISISDLSDEPRSTESENAAIESDG